MSEDKEVIRKTSWGYVVLGALLLLIGFIMVFQGMEAYRTGTIIPPTTKSGPRGEGTPLNNSIDMKRDCVLKKRRFIPTEGCYGR